jgi:hypothetical protein
MLTGKVSFLQGVELLGVYTRVNMRSKKCRARVKIVTTGRLLSAFTKEPVLSSGPACREDVQARSGRPSCLFPL